MRTAAAPPCCFVLSAADRRRSGAPQRPRGAAGRPATACSSSPWAPHAPVVSPHQPGLGARSHGALRRRRRQRVVEVRVCVSSPVSPPPVPWDPLLGAAERAVQGWEPPRWVWRTVATLVLTGQVVSRLVSGRVHLPNLQEQVKQVGPSTLGVTLLTSAFVGMVFTIQFVREFARLGLTRSVGGVLALAFARELTPVISAIILAGRCGSAIAAELGTMAVSEQTDTLRVLRTDPVDYLVVPRVLACALTGPLLSLLAFTVGLAASVLLADVGYGVPPNVILESAAKALVPWDIVGMLIKSSVFGFIIAAVSCGWGTTTSGGAKGVGESTTAAVVLSLVCIFVADFFLSLLFFQGTGDALRRVSSSAMS